MTRILNFYELHKKRLALITEDNKHLLINFEFRSNPLSPKSNLDTFKKLKFPMNSKKIKCDIYLEIQNKKLLILEISQEKEDIQKLYRVFLVIAFILGKEITLRHYFKEFPFFPIPFEYNIGRYTWNFSMRNKFLRDPVKVIEVGYSLLLDHRSHSHKILPVLLEINSIPSPFVRFFCEFSLLEALVKTKYEASSKIYEKGSVSEKHLKQLLESIMSDIDSGKEFSQKEMLKRKFDLPLVNSKGNLKDKIFSFTKDLGYKKYDKHIADWNKLRNTKSIGHGAIWSNKKIDISEKDLKSMRKLHEFLTDIIYDEYTNLI